MKPYPLSLCKMLIMALISAVIMLTGCSKDPVVSPNEDPTNDLLKSSIELTADEILSVLHMLEEEKLAMDVYNLMFATYELQIFERIAQSESKHVLAVAKFLDTYEITYTGDLTNPGAFVDEGIQQLYYDLTTQGMQSRYWAIQTGIDIENLDIVDIQYYLDYVIEAKDIEKTYTHLLEGSVKHLAAFEAEMN